MCVPMSNSINENANYLTRLCEAFSDNRVSTNNASLKSNINLSFPKFT